MGQRVPGGHEANRDQTILPGFFWLAQAVLALQASAAGQIPPVSTTRLCPIATRTRGEESSRSALLRAHPALSMFVLPTARLPRH